VIPVAEQPPVPEQNADKKKGPLARSKRPKSREETPKEGGGNARRYRTAIRYTATHKWHEEK
jgi:hypothetical protein